MAALSGVLTKKCNLDTFDRKHERACSVDQQSFHRFATNSSVVVTHNLPATTHNTPTAMQMHRETARHTATEVESTGFNNEGCDYSITPTHGMKGRSPIMLDFGRTTTSFPLRKPKRTRRGYSSQPKKNLPRLQISYTKGLLPTSTFTKHTIKASLIKSRSINGPIQLKHYIEPKDPLAPLVLPNINTTGPDLDRVDSFVRSSRMKIANRPKNVYDHGFVISKPAFMVKMTTGQPQVIQKTETPRQDSPSPWVTQSMATPSIAPSTSPTIRSKAVKSTVS